jgi:hypothetical protein
MFVVWILFTSGNSNGEALSIDVCQRQGSDITIAVAGG